MTDSGDSHSRTAEVDGVVEQVRAWVLGRPDVLALALAGSWARGDARADSDVDLLVLTADPDAYLGGAWLASAVDPAADIRTRRWGPLLERRFRLPSGLEVELGFAPVGWAAVPADPGTARVVSDGFVVLHDPSGLLERLVRAVARGS